MMMKLTRDQCDELFLEVAQDHLFEGPEVHDVVND